MVAISALNADLGRPGAGPADVHTHRGGAGPLTPIDRVARHCAPPVDLVGRLTHRDEHFPARHRRHHPHHPIPHPADAGQGGGDLALPAGHPGRALFEFIGNPIVALLLAVILSMFTFGYFIGKDTKAVGGCWAMPCRRSPPIMLIIGAGGALKQMLIDVKLGAVIAHACNSCH
jgi:GntP family gluconate:H+ symporter